MNIKNLFKAWCFMTNDAYRDLTILEELQNQNNNTTKKVRKSNNENNNKIEKTDNKNIIGTLSITDEGVLSLDIYKMEFCDGTKIDLNEVMTDKDRIKLTNSLKEMNEVIIGRINKELED